LFYSGTYVTAETVADLIYEDRIFRAVLDGTTEEFGCSTLQRAPGALVRVYESVLPESEYVTFNTVLAKFTCVSLTVEVSYGRGGDEDFVPSQFPSSVRIELSHSDLNRFIGSMIDVPSDQQTFDATQENAMVSSILRAISDIAPESCSPETWRIQPDGPLAVRDESGIPSYNSRTLVRCGVDPEDSWCSSSFGLYGRYYPSKAYLFIQRVQSMLTCA
jgi:hypothetical protein